MSPEVISRLEKKDDAVLASSTFAYIAQTYNLSKKRVLDIGCGHGSFMQRFGDDSIGVTTSSMEVEYGALKKRDIRIGNAENLKATLSTSERFDVIWCNNILEHLLSPHSFLVHLKEFSHNDTLLILGTPIVPAITPLTTIKKFRGALAHEHINFFNHATYRLTAERAGWHVHALRSFVFKNTLLDMITHIFAPHLYLIAHNDISYHYHDRKKSEWSEEPYYADLLSIMGTK